jgi:hypothetical protein
LLALCFKRRNESKILMKKMLENRSIKYLHKVTKSLKLFQNSIKNCFRETLNQKFSKTKESWLPLLTYFESFYKTSIHLFKKLHAKCHLFSNLSSWDIQFKAKNLAFHTNVDNEEKSKKICKSVIWQEKTLLFSVFFLFDKCT